MLLFLHSSLNDYSQFLNVLTSINRINVTCLNLFRFKPVKSTRPEKVLSDSFPI